ncbi:MAG TPA: hypothetical protein DCS19_10415 [Flavobacterium sp.]|nr:hypothetical protein [Flavobacterium sp.]
MNTQTAVETIKNAMPFANKDMQMAAELLQVATDDFTSLSIITSVKTSVADDFESLSETGEDFLDELKIRPSEYESFKDTEVSMKDLVIEFAGMIESIPNSKPDKSKKIRIMKLKAKALVLMQKQRMRTK